MSERKPTSIDDYIATAAPEARPILEKIRATIREVAPDAEEKISYQMPAFVQGGILIYFAAFKKHIGVYPPVSGDAALMRAVAPYTGEKGNLKFPLDAPIPYALIARIVTHRLTSLTVSRSVNRRVRIVVGTPTRRSS